MTIVQIVEKTWSSVIRIGKLIPVPKKVLNFFSSLDICLKLCHELNEHFLVSGKGAGSVRPIAKITHLLYLYFDRYMLFTVNVTWRL